MPPKKPVTERRVFATWNGGRANSAAPVRRSMREAEQFLRSFGFPVVFFLQEMDEGDKGYNDHALIKEIFGKWNKAFMSTREPILMWGESLAQTKSWPAAKGLAGYTPARVINDGILWTPRDSGPGIGIQGGHYPAGAHNGQRPPAVKKQLRQRYDNMLDVHRKHARAHRASGRNNVWGMDTNWRKGFPKIINNEVTLRTKGPDWLRASAAPGYRVKIHRRGEKPMHIESLHSLLWAVVSFPKE